MTKNDNLTSPPRQRTSVAIQGLDRSTPDDIVTDGKCEELHNLRWKDNAWRPVHPHRGKMRLTDIPTEYKVVYHHPAADKYIVELLSGGLYYYYFIADTEANYQEALTLIASFPTQQEVSHFGNVLMFSNNNQTKSFLYEKGEYKEYITPLYARTRVVDYHHANIDPASVKVGADWVKYVDGETSGNFEGSWFPILNATQKTLQIVPRDGKWHGEMLLFTTFVMEDGTNLSPSPLHLIQSNTSYALNSAISRKIVRIPDPIEEQGLSMDEWVTENLDRYIGIRYLPRLGLTSTTPIFEPLLKCCAPTVRISIPKDQNTDIAKRIAIWGTRVLPTWKTDLYTDAFSGNIVDMFADNDLANQPFYLIKEVAIDTMTDLDSYWQDESSFIESNSISIDIQLTADVMNNIVFNKVYVPNNNIHTISALTTLDYNRSLHMGGAIISPAAGYNPYSNAIEGEDTTFAKAIYLTIEGEDKVMGRSVYTDKSIITAPNTPLHRIISYPDHRAYRYVVDEHFDVDLKQALANNFAWHHSPHTEFEKFPAIPLDGRIDSDIDVESFSHSVETNNLIVSSPNNPFSFPFENSYSFGSSNNRILAMQSAAIEMHEMKVGEMPLYVFTEEGIFALVAGQNTLYASVAAINYDKIINPNTLAINGAIVYITEKGVHLLTSAGTQVISTPIHDKSGMPPLDFLRECKIIWPKQYNEIVLLKEGNPEAYVYNLDSGYWSTRTLDGVKLNTDELYSKHTIYDLADEVEVGVLDAEIVTRPIKLGNVEFKRLETIIPRVQMNNCEWIMTIRGAVSPEDYRLLRSVDDSMVSRLPIVIRRTPFSAKYFKVTFEKLRHDGVFAITHIDFEWYHRFRHRMR